MGEVGGGEEGGGDEREGRGGERRGDLALATTGEGLRKLPDTMKSMVMKINTPEVNY